MLEGWSWQCGPGRDIHLGQEHPHSLHPETQTASIGARQGATQREEEGGKIERAQRHPSFTVTPVNIVGSVKAWGPRSASSLLGSVWREVGLLFPLAPRSPHCYAGRKGAGHLPVNFPLSMAWLLPGPCP